MRGSTLILLGMLGFRLAHAQTEPATNPAPVAATAPAPNPALGPAFRTACWKGDLAEATRLLDAGAPLEGRDSSGRTPLFLACHGNESDIVKLLLAHGAKVNVVASNGDTTIGRACEYGDLASAQMLISAGADPGKANQYGHTPLMLAAREGHDSLVAFLITQHVDVNVEGKGESALSEAVWKDHPTIVTMLFDAGAKVPVFAITPDSLTIMGCAAVTKDIPLVDILLAHGADINGAGDHGATALLVAIDESTPEMVGHLLEKGADPNKQDDQYSPLYRATFMHKLDEMQMLLDHHADINAKSPEGWTALIRACNRDDKDEARFLLEHGADPNIADPKGETALSYANNRGDADVAQLLLAHGAHPQEPHIIDGEKPADPLTLVQNWALAVAAIYTQVDGLSHHLLGAGGDAKPAVDMLRESWSVTDNKTLLARLDNLQDKGQRAEFQKEGAQLAAMSDLVFAVKVALMKPEDAHQATALRSSYLKWKDRTGLAWDLCRAANLVNTGFAAKYIDEQESWNRLFAIAELVQKNFGSWQELCDNFLDGREIWATERDPNFEARARLLLNPKDPNSPWNQNPWKTRLSGSPTTDATPAQ